METTYGGAVFENVSIPTDVGQAVPAGMRIMKCLPECGMRVIELKSVSVQPLRGRHSLPYIWTQPALRNPV